MNELELTQVARSKIEHLLARGGQVLSIEVKVKTTAGYIVKVDRSGRSTWVPERKGK